MGKVSKAIIATGVINLITNNLILAISIGWLIYYYESQKDDLLH